MQQSHADTVAATAWRPPEAFHRPVDERITLALRTLARSQPPAITLRARFEDGEILLDLVKVEAGLRGCGLGTSALRALLEFADSHGLPVSLHALSLPGEGEGPDQLALQRWYERHGFADTGERSVMGLTSMRRQPKSGKIAAEFQAHPATRRPGKGRAGTNSLKSERPAPK